MICFNRNPIVLGKYQKFHFDIDEIKSELGHFFAFQKTVIYVIRNFSTYIIIGQKGK